MNPSNGRFLVESEKYNLTNLSIYNSLGQLIRIVTLEGNKTCEIDVTFLSDGMYYAVFNTNIDQEYSVKIIITK